jgi:hypothetical protein
MACDLEASRRAVLPDLQPAACFLYEAKLSWVAVDAVIDHQPLFLVGGTRCGGRCLPAFLSLDLVRNTDNDPQKEVTYLNDLRSFLPARLLVIPAVDSMIT